MERIGSITEIRTSPSENGRENNKMTQIELRPPSAAVDVRACVLAEFGAREPKGLSHSSDSTGRISYLSHDMLFISNNSIILIWLFSIAAFGCGLASHVYPVLLEKRIHTKVANLI